MRACEAFAALPLAVVQACAASLEDVEVAPGAPVVRQGEAGEAAFLVRKGAAVVSREAPSSSADGGAPAKRARRR